MPYCTLIRFVENTDLLFKKHLQLEFQKYGSKKKSLLGARKHFWRLD